MVHSTQKCFKGFYFSKLTPPYSSECVARRGVYSTHKHSSTQGEAISSVVGHVSTRVTSKAIMSLIKNAKGHSPIRLVSSLPLNS